MERTECLITRLKEGYIVMPKKENVYVVEGFAFTSETEAKQAQKESEGIKLIKEKANMANPEMMLQIYNKMIREKMFVTAVGYAYLYDLQEYLRTNPAIKDEDILPIEVVHPSLEEGLREEKQKHQAKLNEVKKKAAKKTITNETLLQKYKISLVVNLILAVSVIGMFLITATSKHPTILNYETELLNRYSAWEQELSEREAALREAENR